MLPPVPRTGVIYVTTEAQKLGFRDGDPDWCNLGQGQPETGPLPGAPPRVHTIPSTSTIRSTRRSRASGSCARRRDLYNELYRKGMPSQYTAENVSISGGGRVSLTRAAAALGHDQPRALPARLHGVRRAARRLPALHAHPDPARARAGLRVLRRRAAREMMGRGLGAILLSNPCNPTGKVVGGDELAAGSQVARELDCTLLSTSSTRTTSGATDARPGPMESAARYVEDVDRDPVVIFDGLTKNWRYPGWRMTWTIAPKSVIDASRAPAASSTAAAQAHAARGRPCSPTYRDVPRPRRSTKTFSEKRELMLLGARELGVRSTAIPRAPSTCGARSRRCRAAQRRHGLLPRGARPEGHHRARASSST
jgi:N-succinyldiaminopimelate aminotransferase